MSQAAITFQNEANSAYTEIYNQTAVSEIAEPTVFEGLREKAASFFDFDQKVSDILHSFYNWEFFSNELEYE